MSELDKFKRRVIRSVARLMLHEKKTDDELWAQMKKETGCDCKQLWSRMRGLTIRKLKRQLASDDRVDTIASLARMSLTDWLLFDLVLVHEKIDFIGKESMMSSNKDMRVLVNLFELVRMFEIEGQRGDALADAWTGATVHYNSLGYQCSPMLLQRRWYQLKELTRERFYAFWYKYRGNVKKISEDGSQAITPTPLLADLAKQYPHVITDPFPEWEKLIEQRLVIMPQEFENKMREHRPPRPVNDAEPEIILVEPVVETIDLSETEQVAPKSDTQLDPTVKVKSEPVDIDENDELLAQNAAVEDSAQDTAVDDAEIKDSIQITSALAATEAEEQAVTESNDFEHNNDTVKYENAETDLEQNIENNVDSNETVMPQISHVFGNVFIDEETLSQLDPVPEKSPEHNMNQNSEVNEDDTIVLDSSSDIVDTSLDTSVLNQEVTIPLSDDELTSSQEKRLVDDASANIMNEALPTVKSEDIMPYIQSASTLKIESELEGSDKEESEINDINSAISQDDKIPQNVDTSIADLENIEDDIIQIKTVADNAMEMEDLETFGIIPTDLDFADDGIEFVEEENTSDEVKAEIRNESEQAQGEEETPKFDLKLLMNPVVVVKKLDDVSILKGIELDNSFHAGSKILIDCIETECKAVPSVIDNTKIIPSVHDESVPDETECNIVRSVIDNKITIPPANDDTIAMCVQEIKKEILQPQSDESDDEIPDSQRVKLSSNLLQKPRSRSYNPIQLCKNPDFNTRLKRLSIGFFGSMRNRQLLKSCKPMTIDLHKSFEPKLIDGTLYLKRSDTDAIVTNKEDGESEQSASVLPSAMSVQSLIDCSVGTFLYPAKPDDNIVTERKKVINLPDITEVRRINRKLLTAEVTPIRVQNEMDSAPEQPIAIIESPLVSPENIPPAINSIVCDAKPIDVQVKSEDDNVTATDKETFVVEGEVESSTAIKMRNTIQEITATENEILKTATPSQSEIAETPTVSKEKEAITPVEAKTRKCPARRPYMSLPWLSKVRPLPTADDTLLTMDSLVKMLNVLSNGEETPAFTPKKLRKIRHKVKTGKLTTESCDLKEVENTKDSELIKSSASDDCKQTDEATKSEKQKKLKIRVSHAVNGQRHKNGNYCCWASEKYFRQTIKNSSTEKHPCPPNECTCCCMNALQNAVRAYNSGERRILKACETIESVVRQNQNFNMLPTDSQITTIIDDEEQPDQNVADSTIPSNDFDTTQVDVQEVATETTPPRDQIHIDAVRGEIRVTSGNTTNVMDVQGEITVRTSANESEYPNLIPDEMLIKPRKRASQVVQQEPKEPLFRYVKAATNRRLGSKNLTTSGTVDTSESHIVIDGSKTAPELSIGKYPAPKPRAKHKLVLLKDQTKQGTKEYDRPISLGKNMILLTTVQIPRKITFVTSEQSSGMIPKLPPGVKLILQPNGELVVSVEPGTKLTDDEIASLPKLMAAVQQQLKINSLDATQPRVEPADVVTISDDENKTSNETPSTVDDNINDVGRTTDLETLQTEIGREQGAQVTIGDQSQVTNEQVVQTNIPERHVAHVEEPLNTEITPPEISNPVSENSLGDVQENVQDSSQEPADIFVQGNTINNETIESQNFNNTISQTTVDQPHITTVEGTSASDAKKDEGTVGSTIKKTILSDLMEMSGISTEDTMITSQENPPESTPESMPTMILSDGGTKVQELNPINYFSELKYASEMGGKFFKLNMITRVLIPINVSIKKQFPVPSLTPLKIAPKPVIDLTEDDDISVEPKNPSKFGHLTQVLAHNICNSLIQKHNTSITPLKLFRSVHSNILRRSKLIAKRNKRDTSVPAHGKAPKKRGRKRKQDFNDQIEVQIDLLDSDEPMEEEYLYDSFGDGASLASDSSDDEPLLNKVKRRNPIGPPITPGSRSLLKHMHIANEALAGTSNVPTDEAPEKEVPIDELDENMDMNIEYLSDHSDNENADENCILGV